VITLTYCTAYNRWDGPRVNDKTYTCVNPQQYDRKLRKKFWQPQTSTETFSV